MLKEVDVVSPDSSNKRYRVMSGLMDRHDADSTCATLRRDHQACEVVNANQGKVEVLRGSHQAPASRAPPRCFNVKGSLCTPILHCTDWSIAFDLTWMRYNLHAIGSQR